MGMTKEGRRKHVSLSGNTVIFQFCFTDILIISHMTCANMSNPSAVNCHRAEYRALHLLQIAVQHFRGVRATAACFFFLFVLQQGTNPYLSSVRGAGECGSQRDRPFSRKLSSCVYLSMTLNPSVCVYVCVNVCVCS